MDLRPIPEKYDDVTPEWLDAALRSNGVITYQTVTGVTFEPLGAEYGRTSSLAIIHPSYDQSGDGPSALFAKLVSTIQSNREFTANRDLFRQEIELYRSLGPRLPVPMPRFYYGDYDDNSDLAVLMMEMVPGRRTTDLPQARRNEGLNAGTQRVALGPLAAMHAQWWEQETSEKFDWVRDWTELSGSQLIGSSDQFPPADQREAIRPYLSDAGLALYDRAPRELERIDEALATMPRTLCHGDYHQQNMLWDSLPDADSVVVVDWQIVNWGPAVRDLAYFLGLSTGKHRGADFVADQVKFYYDQLPAEIQHKYTAGDLNADLAPAILDQVVRFQGMFAALDFALPNAAEFAGNLFDRVTTFGIAVGADDWLAS